MPETSRRRYTPVFSLLISVMVMWLPQDARAGAIPLSFSDLPGWQEDAHREALRAFRRSCEVKLRAEGKGNISVAGVIVSEERWRQVCAQAGATASRDEAAQAFFETFFRPYRLQENDKETGLFTGYFEPALKGALSPDERFRYPVYRRPEKINSDGKAYDRRAIDNGALAGRGLELLWVEDPVELFFLHIQGSGRVLLPDGTTTRLGYDGNNGHDYHAIGKTLIERGEIAKDAMSAEAIKDWLRENPDQATDLLHMNPRYIFFREIEGDGPVGAQGVALTPERSLAVDPEALPYGLPLWLETTLPETPNLPAESYRRLMIAQDTGSAIKGLIRGDIFFGFGSEAEERAAYMQQPGRLYVLLPRAR